MSTCGPCICKAASLITLAVYSTDLTTLCILFAVATAAAAFDAVAGGGGLITLPALLVAGLDPVSALATNKLQSSGGSVSATLLFAQRGLIDAARMWPFAAAAGIAACVGALCATHAPQAALAAAVPLVLVAAAAYFAFGPRLQADGVARREGWAVPWCGAIGFYDGLFGPGAGSFYMIGFVALMGLGLMRATAQTKLANAASNLGALSLFAAHHAVVWRIGLVMLLGAALGGQIGSRIALRHGARLIRPLIVTMSCLMAIRLIADPHNPLHRALAASWTHVGS